MKKLSYTKPVSHDSKMDTPATNNKLFDPWVFVAVRILVSIVAIMLHVTFLGYQISLTLHQEGSFQLPTAPYGLVLLAFQLAALLIVGALWLFALKTHRVGFRTMAWWLVWISSFLLLYAYKTLIPHFSIIVIWIFLTLDLMSLSPTNILRSL